MAFCPFHSRHGVVSFHGISPTADRLVRFRMNVELSRFCGAPESLVRLFMSCVFAFDVWAWFSSQLNKCKPASPEKILFGFSSTVEDKLPIAYEAFLGVLRHHILLA